MNETQDSKTDGGPFGGMSTRLITILLLSSGLLIFQATVSAQDWGSMQVSYIREVGNYLYLSDFQLGSEEWMVDKEGHGVSVGWLFRNKGTEFFLFNLGYSQAVYTGSVEDGVNVSFQPKSGSGLESLSESRNIVYNVDLKFDNPFISFSYTNWNIVVHGMEASNIPWPSTYGFGLIFQTNEGGIEINGVDGSRIATAGYDSGTRRFALLGWDFNFEFMYVSLILRHVESPVLKIESCNAEAVGDLACERILAATGNRNAATTVFTGGVLAVGILF